MTQSNIQLVNFYKGWDVYQDHLLKAIAPLSPDQLALRTTSHLRSIGAIATHVVGARARWFHGLMGEGGPEIAPLQSWDRDGSVRNSTQLVDGLEQSWRVIQEALTRWTPADLEYVFRGTRGGEEYEFTRQWVIWHVIEHDLHHGGEISFSLGMHGLAALDL